MAEILHISDELGCSAKAAAADALERVGHEDAILCIWVDKDGRIRYSKANTNLSFAAVVAAYANHWTSRWLESIQP